jgi:hypothetical protein
MIDEGVRYTALRNSFYAEIAEEMEAWVSTYTAIAAGELSAVSNVVARYAGHPPMSFAEYLPRKR